MVNSSYKFWLKESPAKFLKNRRSNELNEMKKESWWKNNETASKLINDHSFICEKFTLKLNKYGL